MHEDQLIKVLGIPCALKEAIDSRDRSDELEREISGWLMDALEKKNKYAELAVQEFDKTFQYLLDLIESMRGVKNKKSVTARVETRKINTAAEHV